MKLNDLIPLFVQIVSEEKFKKLGSPFTYNLSDDVKTNILTRGAFEIDIKSAFPTICKLMYGENDSFVQNIYNIEDKIERNKYIAITLKQQGDKDGKQYLADLNLWSKILTMGYVYSRFKDIVVIQYIKDGVVFIGTHKNKIDNISNQFISFIKNNKIVFHERQIDTFIRFNKTSIVTHGKEISVKGDYKDLPPFIHQEILPSLLSGGIYDYPLLNDVKKIYSKIYFQTLRGGSLVDEINHYYKINGQYLNSTGKYDSLLNVEPRSYLRYIIYPILSLCRLSQNNI